MYCTNRDLDQIRSTGSRLSTAMILLPDDLSTSKLGDNVAATPTNRYHGVGLRPPSPSLPDYETSEAQHNPAHRPRSKRISDARFWRATCTALAIYLGITLVIGVPFFFIRMKLRRAQWMPMGMPLLWDQEVMTHVVEDNVLFAPESKGCYPWQMVQDHPVRGELYSTSFQEFVPAKGPFAFASNASLPIPLSTKLTKRQNYNGIFILKIDPSLPTSRATISLDVRASSIELRDQVHACLNNTSDEGSGLSIYVPDRINPTDMLNLTLTLSLPSVSTTRSHIVWPPPSLFGSPDSSTAPPMEPLKIEKLTARLPGFTHRFAKLTGGHGVFFQKVRMESEGTSVFVEDIKAHDIRIKTSLAEITGSFQISGSLTLDTISAPINANVTVSPSHKSEPNYVSMETGQSPINAHVTFQASSRPVFSNRHQTGLIMHLKTFGAPLNATVFSEQDSSGPRLQTLQLHAHSSMANSEVVLLGNNGSWFEGAFDVQTKLAHAQVIEPPSFPDQVGTPSRTAFDYERSELSRVVGQVRPRESQKSNNGRTREPQGRILIVNSLADAVLSFGRLRD